MSRFVSAAILAAVAVGSAVISAQAVVWLSPRAPDLRAARAEARTNLSFGEIQAATGERTIAKSGDGHFWAKGLVNGAPVRFLVDTGATAVALTPEDAQRLGIRMGDLQFGSRVVTAGGQARAAPVKLASVSVAGAELKDVEALVIEKGLDASLLGMSYLGRLSRFEGTRNTLVLER